MKRITLFTAATVAIMIVSCSNGGDATGPRPVQGTWRLTNVSGGIAGTSDDFNDGSIVWTFNPDGTINVLNTNTDDQKQDLIETGNYTYEFVPNTTTPQSCPEALAIGGVSYGCYSVAGNTLTLTQVESDGYQITLKKIVMATTKR